MPGLETERDFLESKRQVSRKGKQTQIIQLHVYKQACTRSTKISKGIKGALNLLTVVKV